VNPCPGEVRLRRSGEPSGDSTGWIICGDYGLPSRHHRGQPACRTPRTRDFKIAREVVSRKRMPATTTVSLGALLGPAVGSGCASARPGPWAGAEPDGDLGRPSESRWPKSGAPRAELLRRVSGDELRSLSNAIRIRMEPGGQNNDRGGRLATLENRRNGALESSEIREKGGDVFEF